ncbi:carbamoyltransferase family protein [Puia sp. P3]|uniref:carbamoyltransferase family protein n=1 Tax=Puia sp. P3 TaxID=3423952 RepID=UPI003D66D81F
MKILGISAFYHDSAAAIIQDGVIVAAAQEERFSRIKNDPGFPSKAVEFCLHYSGIRLSELDAIAFYDKPFLKFERLLETYYSFAPSGLGSFLQAMPVWIKEKLFLKKILYRELGKLGPLDKRKVPLLFPEHHLSHAASAYYPSGFEDAAILTLDGVGEWATMSLCRGSGKDITILKQLDFPHSLGLLYSAFTYYCGFAVNSGEYKLMGLAPYGNRDGADCRRMVEIIKTKLVTIKEDGSIFLHQENFGYATGDRMVKDRVWQQLFGFPRRTEDGPLDQRYCDMALAVQEVTEEVVMRLARELKELTGCENLCMAGGVALNCVANGKLDSAELFKQMFIQPAAGDAGGALGAALAAQYIYFGKERRVEFPDAMHGSLLGPEYGETDILPVARKYNYPHRMFSDPAELTTATAKLIADGNIVGWFQGRSEFGPRALGARSILADARSPEMQKKLNLSIKMREGFRPFAPAVLAEEAGKYFELTSSSPYMLLVKEVKRSRQIPVPADFEGRGWADKLYLMKSDIPAVTHVDYSARIQTVDKRTNPLFWQLLRNLEAETGYGVVVNTSFNVRDEPIVNSPEDAFRCFGQTQIDYLVIGNYIFGKKEYIVQSDT